MKVSVIISNYNYARYVSAAIDSVLAQTYQDIEIVVVDDGSTDDSCNAIAQYQQRFPDRIKAIFQTNQGQGAALNTGFEVSSGEIITFLDADDVWKPNKLQRVVEALSAPDVVGVMHHLDTIDGDGNITNNGSTNRRIPSGSLARIIVNTGNAWYFPPTSGLAYRRSILKKVLPMDTVSWRLCADGALVYCTAFLGKITTLNEVLGSYRIHGMNNYWIPDALTTSEKKAKWKASMEMTNQSLNNFLERLGYPERIDLSRNLDYRRTQHYWRGKWDTKEVLAISGLILNWSFYTWQERVYYLARFLLKSAGFIARPKYQKNDILNNPQV